MAKMFTVSPRWLVGACCALLLSGVVVAIAPHATAQGQNQNSNQTQPKKKKLPAGAKGFEQYAGRDASDKLITGGATRGICPGCPPPPTAEVSILRGTTAFIEADDKKEAGQVKEAAAKYKEAEEAFKAATVADPRNFKAWSSLAYAYETQQKYKEAADAYRRATKLTPAPPAEGEQSAAIRMLMTYYNLGNVLAADNQHQQAIEAYKQVSAQQPGLALPYYQIGLSYAAMGMHDADAIKAFQDAIDRFKEAAKDPDFSSQALFEQAYYNLGLLYSKSDKPEDYVKAIDAFREAVKLDPNHAEAHYNLGLVYYLTDNRSGLIEQQRALLTKKPELAKELAKLMSQ
jgi:tetratricopeptide (TPR) repeat protein